MRRLVAASVVLLLVGGPLTSGAGAQSPDVSPSSARVPAGEGAPPAAVAGAVAVNVFRIPGKTLLCGLTVLTSTGLMLLTFGTQYRAVGAVFREGCGGKWVIGPGDLARNVDPPQAVFSSDP